MQDILPTFCSIRHGLNIRTALVTIALAVGLINHGFGQERKDFQIKEQYDVFIHHVLDVVEHPCVVNADQPLDDYLDEIGETFGDGCSRLLESYLIMCETTKDKAYLIKFVNVLDCEFQLRFDQLNLPASYLALHDGSPYSWSLINDSGTPTTILYIDGQIIWPMAHFVHLINSQYPDLQSFSTPLAHNQWLGAQFTFGELADWLGQRVDETIDRYYWGGYWKGAEKGFSAHPSDDDAMVINLQSAIAAAMYYMGQNDPNEYYLQAADDIASDWFRTLVCFPELRPVLELAPPNRYQWVDIGWKYPCPDSDDDYEDLSHAMQSLELPMTVKDNTIWAPYHTQVFSETDLVRLHNAYTEGAYAGATPFTIDGVDYENPHFHAGIDGDDDIDYNTVFSGLDQTRGTVYSATWLSKWDDTSGASQQTLYDLIMKLYFHDLYGQGVSALGQYTNATSIPYGLAQLVSEQWERECFSLELRNRVLSYDQDFAAKDVLVIAPGNGPGRSFADPETFDPVFEIGSGVKCNMKAGSAIHWEPGFHAAYGSTVHAYIDPAGCGMGYKVRAGLDASINAERSDVVHPVPDPERQVVNRAEWAIAPNPTDASSIVRITLCAMVGDGVVNLYDVSGRCLYRSPVIERDQSEFILPLYGLALAPGSYTVVQQEGGKVLAASPLLVK